MGIELLPSHIALSSADMVADICKPLEKLGITYFSFVRSFKDGSHIRLSNNPAWTQHYYSREFYNVVINQVPDAEGNIPWSCIDRYPLFHDASEYFDVDNGIVMVITSDDIVERYFFGSTRENRQVNYIYLHQIDILKKFVLYFKEYANSLIDKATKTRIMVPKPILDDEDEKFYSNDLISEFLDDIQIKKVCIRAKGEDIFISQNEAKILSLMKCGYTAKNISNEIGLTPKTVEIYRDKLKTKLNQYSRNNLVSLAKSNSLLDMELFN